ncbi:MAG: ferritin-like domain-containing protein, partial [Myxococcota bacterium]|nr:ferritin-like domain-containing protein [Myxococcota bacterium]
MILRAIRRMTRPLHQPSMDQYIPYDMFDLERTAVEARRAQKMERIYHKGQEKIWDGKTVLAELLEEHGGVQLEPEKLVPLRRLFAVIFWGELAAWKVSSELALVLEPLEAKMAAASQAHDEARHFYVMHDYLALLDYQPQDLPPAAHRILVEILRADSLAKKLLGMQLMVEPIALTLFHLVRENRLEPVLSDLLAYYERDEARHV